MKQKRNGTARLPVMIIFSVIGLMAAATTLFALPPGIKGKFIELKEPSTHTRGKVKLIEFADFYCPHCHMFEQAGIPVLQKEFGERLEVTMVGFPVIPGKLPTPFDMYEQAKTMGKGEEMKRVLFRTIHKDKMHILDKVIRGALIKEVGLDPVAFEAGLASGKPAKAVEAGRALGKRIDIQQTPTVVLDGNIKAESIDPENLMTIIRSILEADGK